MEAEVTLAVQSKPEWIQVVMGDFNSFLQDHADCERKASAMAMGFVAKYPDRTAIIPELITTAVEELRHFQQVYKLMAKRSITLNHEMADDLYIKQLIWLSRSGREERFLDRMIIAAVVAFRAAERLRLVADALKDPQLKDFYQQLWESEMAGGNAYLHMLTNYFEQDKIDERLEFFLKEEGKILDNLDVRPALH